jgi:protein-tyrosine phosphatase
VSVEPPTPTYTEGRPWRLALLWLIFLGPFFFGSYGLANWVSSLRANVPSVVFGWEHHVPFLAWTIVPYWSIDALYVLSLFVCTTRKELNTHARRLTAATGISIAVFLLYPLRFGFERPPTGGFFGAMFDLLMGFDKPFNQAPSLHISLLVIIWARFVAHASGFWRSLLHGWFALIGVSVLTTYQHHFIDLPTGLWVGLFCIWLFPLERSDTSACAMSQERKRHSIGVAYLLPGGALAIVAPMIGGLGWLLWWPAGALLLVAAAYFFGDASFFRKRQGRMQRAAFWMLLPYLAGAWLNSRWWTRNADRASEVQDGVLLGRAPSCEEHGALGVKSMVDVAAELPACSSTSHYRDVPMLDLVVPSVEQIQAGVSAIEALSHARPTLVCCALGYSRSAAVVAAWLVATARSSTIDGALQTIRERRPQVALRDAHRQRLHEWRAVFAP